jgi:hypothetical protein
MLYKGITEIEVSGKKQGLKFGMLASGIFCQTEGVTLKEMTVRLQNPTPFTAINCVYSAAKAFDKSKKIDSNYTPEDVADWIDEIGIDKIFEIILSSMNVYDGEIDKKEKSEKN